MMKTKAEPKMKNSFDYDIAIIGAGASGLAAAITAAGQAPGLSVAVFEKKETAGKKLSASGNGRCNLSNIKCEHLEEVMDFFGNAGIAVCKDREGRLYPYSQEAGAVTSLLAACAKGKGAVIHLNSEITRMEAEPDGGFLLFVGGKSGASSDSGSASGPSSSAPSSHEIVRAKTVLMAAGGKSYASMGTTGDGYIMARKLGHSVTGLIPALTAVEVSEDIKPLKGVRTKAEVFLYKNGEMIFSERGEVQFREDSLSGICVMNMSRYIKRDGEYKIRLNITPDFSRRELKTMLRNKMSLTGLTAAEALKTLVKGQLILLVLKEACISPDEEGVSILADTGKYEKLADALECLEFAVKGLKGWNEAQVTAGGVVLSQVDSITMESKVVPGLFFSGEVLDYDGPCGGYNLHHAWLTGIRAGRGMALKCTESIR